MFLKKPPPRFKSLNPFIPMKELAGTLILFTFAIAKLLNFILMSKFIELKSGGYNVLIDVDKITHIIQQREHQQTRIVFDNSQIVVETMYDVLKKRLISLSDSACEPE